MKALNFGSLNLDFVYAVSHFVRPGETISSKGLHINCGGKGLNQSIALSKAGIPVYHAGKVGCDGTALTDYLASNGVDISYVFTSKERTGNAMIQVDEDGQNSIILYGGANLDIDEEMIDSVLSNFGQGDYLLLQNEINNLSYLMEKAHQAGMKIIFNPSPADESIASLPLSYVSIFLLNEVEGELLTGHHSPTDILSNLHSQFPNSSIVLTLGSKGVYYMDSERTYHHGIFKTDVLDTTAAGDTFTGFFLAAMMQHMSPQDALRQATMASSIAVSRVGAATSIPTKEEVLERLASE